VPPAANYGASGDDYNVIIKISGLPFINNTYNVATRTNTNTTVIGTFQFPTTATSSFQYFYGSNIAQFGRYQNMTDITIDYYRIIDSAQSANAAAKAFPEVCFIFDIFPIDESNKDNGSRMDFAR
jgi:hypothetical protein